MGKCDVAGNPADKFNDIARCFESVFRPARANSTPLSRDSPPGVPPNLHGHAFPLHAGPTKIVGTNPQLKTKPSSPNPGCHSTPHSCVTVNPQGSPLSERFSDIANFSIRWTGKAQSLGERLVRFEHARSKPRRERAGAKLSAPNHPSCRARPRSVRVSSPPAPRQRRLARRKSAHQFIFHTREQRRRSGVALPTRTPGELSVDPRRFVRLREHHLQPAQPRNSLPQADIRSSPRHVRRDRHRPALPRARDHFRFLFMPRRVEHSVRHAPVREHRPQPLARGNGPCSHEHRPALAMRSFNRLYNRLPTIF